MDAKIEHLAMTKYDHIAILRYEDVPRELCEWLDKNYPKWIHESLKGPGWWRRTDNWCFVVYVPAGYEMLRGDIIGGNWSQELDYIDGAKILLS